MKINTAKRFLSRNKFKLARINLDGRRNSDTRHATKCKRRLGLPLTIKEVLFRKF